MKFDLPAGFRAAGVESGLKKDKLDLGVVINTGPNFDFAGVLTTNEVKAAPVLWTEQIIKTGKAKAVLLNSGGANACTGAQGFQVVHESAEYLAAKLNLAPIDVAICSTGIIGEQLDLSKIKNGIDKFNATTSSDSWQALATAILTTDSKPKVSSQSFDGYSISGIAKGAGMLAPSLATMLCVITTDADISEFDFASQLRNVVDLTFNRISSDGCTSTNDSVLLLSSGGSGKKPTPSEFYGNLLSICQDLAHQIISDAEGATSFVTIRVSNARTEVEALQVARRVSSDMLVKTALFGKDPNWGRVAAAVGATGVGMDPDRLDIYFNGIPLCLGGVANGDRHRVSLENYEILIEIDLNLGAEAAEILTTDLSTAYVLENSEYSS
jgi:glutamate N-acetyltransferase / amino-acid N-acetyltransferase